MLDIYVFFAAAYAAFYFCGYPLRALLLSRDLEKYDLYITPWLGMGVIITVFFPLSWMGYSVSSAKNYFLASVFLLNILAWLKWKKPVIFDRREVIFAVSIAFLTATVFGSLLFLIPGAYAVTSSSDFGSYLLGAKAALHYSAELVKAMPVDDLVRMSAVNLSLNMDYRGCQIVNAFLAALLGREPVHILHMLSAFGMFLSIVTFRLFLKDIRHLVPSVLIIGILVFNVFYQSLYFWGFLGQLFSFGIVTLVFFIELYLTEQRRFDPRTCVLLAYMLTVNALNYIEATAYPLIAVLPMLFALLLDKRYDKKPVLSNAAFSGCLYAAVNYTFLLDFIWVFRELDAKPPAWPINMPSLMDVAGLGGGYALPGMEMAVFIAANILMAAVVICQMRREGMKSFLSFSCAAYMLLYAAFCFRYYVPGEISSYNAYKSALSLSFILVIMTGRFLHGAADSLAASLGILRKRVSWKERLAAMSGKKKYFAAAAVFLAVFAFNVRFTWLGMKKYYLNPEKHVTAEHEALALFDGNPLYAGADFLLNCDSRLIQHLAAYFSPFGRSCERRAFKDGDIYITEYVFEELHQTADARKIFENDIYSVFQLDENSILITGFSGMGRSMEVKDVHGEYAAMRRVEKNSVKMGCFSPHDRAADFSMIFYNSAGSEKTWKATVRKGGEYMGEFAARGEYLSIKLDGIPIDSGYNELTLDFEGDISGVSLTEMRLL